MTFEEILSELEKQLGKKAVGILVKTLKLPGIVGSTAGEMLFPEAAGVPDSDIDWNKAERERLIQEALDAIRNLPTNKPTYTKGKPTVKVPKNSPDKNKINITVQPGFKLSNLPNSLPPIDPFWVPKELVKRVRAISGKSATKRTYGRMECHPISYADNIVFNVVHDVVGTGRKNEDSLNGAKNFMKWLVRENGNLSSRMIEDSMLEGGGVLTGDILWDQVAYIEPHTPGNWLGSIGFKFGAACIANEAADYESTRQNAALGGIKPVIYWNKPSIVVRGSGDVDLSQRFSNEDLSSSWDGLASKIKEVVEYYGDRTIKQLDIVNSSQGAMSRRLGVGEELFITRTLIDRTKKEEIDVLNEEIKILTESMASMGSALEKKLATQAIEALQNEITEIESGLIKINQIHSLPELGAETLAILGEVIGDFPIKIRIKSGHLLTKSIAPKGGSDVDWIKLLQFNTQDSNKTVDPHEIFEIKVKEDINLNFPNIAECLGEIQIQLLNMTGIQNLQQEMLNRVASQLCSLTSTSITTHDLTDAIADFLGFKITHHDDYYTLAFDPLIANDPENKDLLKFLIGRNVNYKRPAFDISKETQTLTAKLFWYDRASSIIQAKEYRRFTGGPSDASMTKSKERFRDFKNFMGHLRTMAQDMGYLDATDPDNPKVKAGVTWDDWKDLYEKGFAEDTTSTADDLQYWNEPKDDRPKVTDGKSILDDNGSRKIYGDANDKPKNWYPH
jgi:hypothetical protein